MSTVEAPVITEHPDAMVDEPTRGPEARTHVVCRHELAEAIIFGREITALCGYRWVPGANPEQFEVCEACMKEVGKGRNPCG